VSGEAKVLNLETAASKLRDEFIVWQCKLRKQAMRAAGGRPSEGMRPRVLDAAGGLIADALTVVMVRTDSATTAKGFEFQYKRTHDPLDRYERAVTFLSADYYQDPQKFTGAMTALIGTGPSRLQALLTARECTFVFSQFSKGYCLPCSVQILAPEDPVYKATYWHNAMFNPNLPPEVAVVAFLPDWVYATRQRDTAGGA
jgi:hypothetical protein